MMRLCLFTHTGRMRLGVELQGKILDLVLAYAFTMEGGISPVDRISVAGRELPPDPVAFLQADDETRRLTQVVIEGALAREQRLGADRTMFENQSVLLDPKGLTFLPPVPQPRKVFGMARNYALHAEEVDRTLKPGESMRAGRFFAFQKPPTCITGPYSPIIIPPWVEKLDYELELAVVVGRAGRHIPVARAYDHVGAYTIINNISDRSYLPAEGRVDWLGMKGQDTFGPLGPYLLIPEAGFDPHALSLSLKVNGEVRQSASTAEMLFSIPQIIAGISRLCTLEPGDIIATGSPAGNAAAFGAFLKDGDIIEGTIEQIGTQRNRITMQPAEYWRG